MIIKNGQVYKSYGCTYTITKETEEYYRIHGTCTVSGLLSNGNNIKLDVYKTFQNLIRIENE